MGTLRNGSAESTLEKSHNMQPCLSVKWLSGIIGSLDWAYNDERALPERLFAALFATSGGWSGTVQGLLVQCRKRGHAHA